MTRTLLIFLIVEILAARVHAQDFPTYIKKNAVRVDKPDSMGKEVYNLLSACKLIMIGEMHGTYEPVSLVGGLAEMFTRFGDSVQVGFEIPVEQMKTFENNHTDSSILQSHFFSKPSIDGRATVAWAAAIRKVFHNPKARVFFFDMAGDYSGQRDSIMYLNIKAEMIAHPGWRTITISGNIHNMLVPHKGENKTAYFLYNDTELNLANKFCSLNHQYESGTMINNTGNGLELKEVGPLDSSYSRYGYDNYLLLYPANLVNPYTGIYFTRKLTAADMVTSK
jgi:hypothetical protein